MENRVEKKYDIETAFKILDLVNSWITAADNKSAILIAFIGLMTGLSSLAFSSFREAISNGSQIQIILIIIAGVILLVLFILIIYSLFQVFRARLVDKAVPTSINLLSYLSISKHTSTEFFELAKQVNDSDLYEMVITQIYINSAIANIKMKHFNRALIFSVLLIPIIILIAITIVL